jgi:hydroxymethylpyrimidine pyrophosphatase-like HAD family hydrolase
MDKKIDRLFVDLDGCLNAGPENGGDIYFPKIQPFDWKPELRNVLELLKFRDSSGFSCHVVTGRSVKISDALIQLFANAPSVVEHGTVIYDFQDVIRERSLIDIDEQYRNLRKAKEELEVFISQTAASWLPELQRHFPGHTLRMLYDNLHIWTIEIAPADIEASEKLKKLINEMVLPVQFIGYIESGYLKELTSSLAYDLLPAVSKKTALESLIRIKRIDVSSSLGIGDSFHSDNWLEVILQGGGVIGCPANSDLRLKDFIGSVNNRGFIASKGYFEGTREILEHFIGDFPG